MKIAILISRLDISGGTERVVATLANNWVHDGYEVDIIVLFQENPPFYQLNDMVNIIGLNMWKYPHKNILQRVLWYKEVCKRLCIYLKSNKVDVLLGIMAQMSFCTTIAGYLCKIKNISCEHTQYYGYGKLVIILRRIIYRFSTAIAVLTHTDKKLFERYCNKNVMVLPNALSFKSRLPINYKAKKVIAVGRLVYSKGFDLLLEAWKRINQKCPGWELIIVGEKQEEDYCKQLFGMIKNYNIQRSVTIVPPTLEIDRLYAEASILVVPSRYEGFSLVLTEGMSMGLSVISFDCPFGPREIINNNIDGILVKNGEIGDLANCLMKLIKNECERIRLGEKATRNVYERYSWERISILWNECFENLKIKM